MSFIRSYVVPEGFPDSVTPSYVPYMSWRAMKVLFSNSQLKYELKGERVNHLSTSTYSKV